MSSTPGAAMVPSLTSSCGPVQSALTAEQRPRHIGDLPVCLLERILVDNLMADGGLPAVTGFVVAAPALAAKAIRNVPHLFTVCGVSEMGFRKDFWFWRKFSNLRHYQSKKALREADNHEETATDTAADAEHHVSGGMADWRKGIPAPPGIDEALWNGDIDFEVELQKLQSS